MMMARPTSDNRKFALSILLMGAAALWSLPASADQGGVSFWLPGLMGSFAASPLQPGLNATTVYYHTSVGASGALAAAKQIEVGRLSPTVSASLNLDLDAKADLFFLIPQYVFETKVFGGQLAIQMMGLGGRNRASLDGTLTASAGPFSVTRQGSITNTATGFGDLFPQANLRWNSGVHNLMVYGTTNIQVGTYHADRLANIGLGFNLWDGGVGYTYLDPAKGHEFSVTAGLTYNNWNRHTDYKNGLDLHVDIGAAQFLNKQFYVGAVGYIYDQLTPDVGSAAFLGDIRSRVFGIGPQLGYMFQAAPGVAGLIAVKGFYEFEAKYRPEGWNMFVTLNLSPAAQSQQKPVSTARPQWK